MTEPYRLAKRAAIFSLLVGVGLDAAILLPFIDGVSKQAVTALVVAFGCAILALHNLNKLAKVLKS